MDFLRLILLLALLVFGVAATERSRAVISAEQEVQGVSGSVEEMNYMRYVAGHASGQPASIVVQDGMLLGTGLDRVEEMFDPTAHAETEAIRDACRRAKTMVLKDGVLYASRKPCNMCMGIIARTGIRKVYFPSVDVSRDSSFLFMHVQELVD
jgi:tRNA(Arg) A34 adenosine deaminase TadA